MSTLPEPPTEVVDILGKNLSEKEISWLLAPRWRERIREYLITLWKQGKVFASDIKRTSSNILPAESARWTTKPISGYFGYHPEFGVYRVGSCDQRLKLQLLATLDVESPVSSIAISPVGNDLVVGLYPGEIVLIGLNTLSMLKRISAHSKRVWGVDFSPDGEKIVSGSQDGEIKVWDKSGNLLQVVAELEDWVTSVRFSPDGTRLISGHKIADPNRAAVRVWRLGPPSLEASFTHHGTGKNVYAVEWLPSGRGFVSGGSDKRVACHLLENEVPEFQPDKHAGTVTSVVVHPEMEWIASGSWSGTIKIWEPESGRVLQTLEAHNTRVTDLVCSPSGELLASGSRDSFLCLWQMPEGRLLSSVRAHDGWVRAVVFCGSNIVVSGGSEGYCKIWALQRSLALEGA